MMGARIRIVMDLLSIDRSRVSSDIGVGVDMVSNYRSGKSNPSYTTLKKFCDVYYVNIDWMVTGVGEVFLRKEIDRMSEAKKILKAVATVKIERNITQKEIQEVLDLPLNYFTDLKKGKISMPMDKVKKLEEVYGVSI